MVTHLQKVLQPAQPQPEQGQEGVVVKSNNALL